VEQEIVLPRGIRMRPDKSSLQQLTSWTNVGISLTQTPSFPNGRCGYAFAMKWWNNCISNALKWVREGWKLGVLREHVSMSLITGVTLSSIFGGYEQESLSFAQLLQVGLFSWH
jgi:hypothetical protein